MKKRNKLDSKRLCELIYAQFNMKFKSKLSGINKSEKKKDTLYSKELRNVTD